MEITNRARNHLRNNLTKVKSSDHSDTCYRLSRDGEEFLLGVDVPGPEDETFAAEGETVLAVEPVVAGHCEGMTLDVDTSEGAPRLVFLPTSPQ